MSLLTPLYIAGVLAVALPILFHLLRRAPQKKQTFSSLMFLAPTPPRFTRRSRISNWLLLLLRAAVLTLLALAFARPFFRQEFAIGAGGAARRHVAILVDTSASMRREDLWQQATKQVDRVLGEVTPADEVSLYLFDRRVRSAFSFEQWNRLDASQRVAALQAVLAAAGPTWEGTSLGDAIGSAAEQLANAGEGKDKPDSGPRTLILISDLQQGSRPEALQGHTWPESVRLDVRPVTVKQGANAGLQFIKPSADALATDINRPRVRVSNSVDSKAEQFTLAWADPNGPVKSIEPIKVYVPAGRGQIVSVEKPANAATADRLILHGDEQDFDNTLFIAPTRQELSRVLFVGRDSFDDVRGLAFYLRTAFSDTAHRRVEVIAKSGEQLTAADLAGTGLVVVGGGLSTASNAALRQFIEAGGNALWLVQDREGERSLAPWLGDNQLSIEESNANGFSLLSRVDTTHPLLSAFADARFGDFSRVHFWKHRKLTLSDNSKARVLATFDNGDPYLLEKLLGRGRLFVMTSGWQPTDSQLAVSAKFVPILEGLLRPREDLLQQTQYMVGETISSPMNAAKAWTVKSSDGQAIALADGLQRPGIYTVETGGGAVPVAVNLPPEESRTTPLSPNDFKQWGAKLEAGVPQLQSAEDRRQAQRAELENRQKLWQWLIVGVLGLVAAETALAGRLARRGAVGGGAAVPG